MVLQQELCCSPVPAEVAVSEGLGAGRQQHRCPQDSLCLLLAAPEPPSTAAGIGSMLEERARALLWSQYLGDIWQVCAVQQGEWESLEGVGNKDTGRNKFVQRRLGAGKRVPLLSHGFMGGDVD